MGTRPKRILIYRIGHIGDTVVSLPALWAIRHHFPEAHITLLCNQQPGSPYLLASQILPKSLLIDDTLAYCSNDGRTGSINSARLLKTLRRSKYDGLVYLAPRLRPRAAVTRDLIFFRLAGIRLFFGHKGLGFPSRTPGLPLPTTDHEADHLLERLALTGIPVPEFGRGEMNLAIDDAERRAASKWLEGIPEYGLGRRLVGLAPGSKWPSKIWPASRVMELGRRLIEELELYPIVVGGAEDAELGERLIEFWGVGSNAAGLLDVRLTAAVLELCSLYVGNDTGAMHLAAAVGTPCVVTMSAQDWPGRWEPYGKGHVVLRKSVPCEGCLLSVCEQEGMRCLNEIQVGEVFEACKRVLAGEIPSENQGYERAVS